MKRNMRIYRNNILILAFFASLLILGGCKSSQKVATVESGAAKAHSDFFDSMRAQSFQFETLSARMNVDLNFPGTEVSSRVDLRMVKDSAFQLSVQPLMGIELFRIEMNRDSIKIIDRMSRRYVAENYANLKEQTPIVFNYNNLQSLFVNHLFLPGEDAVLPAHYNRFQLNQEGSMAEIQTKDKMGLQYIFMADGEEKLLSTYITDKSELYALQWVYSNFILSEGQPFPSLMDVQVFSEGKSKGSIKMHFSKIQTNIPVKVEAPIPDKYTRVTLADILKTLSNKNK